MQVTVRAGADQVWAEDSGGSGPGLVLLHEGIADARMWDPVWPTLAGSCRVVRYDVRGYGRSPKPTEKYSLTDDLRAVLDHFGLVSAHLAGCSMGGGTAVGFALSDPRRVQSLVLLCPGIGGYDWPAEPELDAEFEALAAAGDEDGMVRMGIREWAAAGGGPPVPELMRSAVRAWPDDERYQQELGDDFGRLGGVTVPTVIMVGDRDRPALIASNEEAARRIPGCTLIRMPGTDHYPTLRDPDLVCRTILASCGVQT